MLGAYSPVLRTHQVKPRFAAVFLSAVPLGMLSLTIVLCVHEWTGELMAAGLISGLFGLTNAVGLIIQGPLIDRCGSRPVVMTAGGICAAALLGFGTVGSFGGPLWIIAAMAAAAGMSVPAITTSVRSWLPGVLSEDSDRAASYALLSALFRSAVTVGPLLVSVALLMHGPELAVMIAALLIVAATVVFSFTGERPLRTRAVALSTGSRGRAAYSPGLRTLLIAATLAGLAVGVTSVAVPGIMNSSGVAAIAGAAFGALALGEMLGALVFGSRTWPGQRRVQLPIIQTLVALVALLVFLSSQQPWLLVTAMFGAGIIRAPVSIVKSALLDQVVPAAGLARGYSMLVATGLVSSATGNAIAGLLADHVGVDNLLLVPVLTLALASAWTASRYRTLNTATPLGR
ncbi:MFS transporter [Nesterenkonia muleiensis]|uniref:MFS transporter n=1 Tax=Nesterenkonia muleiensis TaxID=2282648 RepID=UPI000E712FDE|nr:MFS transporter [Nesterenkonia muleiensis]